MTTLTSKLHDVTRQLQHLTVWRPNERDPFFELDRWRTDAHTTIEQVYNKKRQEIEQVIEKHEREFMRQLTRQRSLINGIRKRLLAQKEMDKTQNEPSIFTDLQKIENDISTKLGRGEITIRTTPLNIDESVIVGLKTYFSASSSMYTKEMSIRNQPQKPVRRSTDEAARAFENWKQAKNERLKTANQELQLIRQQRPYTAKDRYEKAAQNANAFDRWMQTKESAGAFKKKKIISDNDDDNKQEINPA